MHWSGEQITAGGGHVTENRLDGEPSAQHSTARQEYSAWDYSERPEHLKRASGDDGSCMDNNRKEVGMNKKLHSFMQHRDWSRAVQCFSGQFSRRNDGRAERALFSTEP